MVRPSLEARNHIKVLGLVSAMNGLGQVMFVGRVGRCSGETRSGEWKVTSPLRQPAVNPPLNVIPWRIFSGGHDVQFYINKSIPCHGPGRS